MDISWKTTKKKLRQRARQTLATLSLEAKNEQSQNICNILEQYIDQYDTRAVYVPFSYEPNIDFFVQKLRDHKKIVVLPQIQDGIMELAIYRPNSIITKWVHGEAKIENHVWYNWSLDVCLVPGLAFDKMWYRLGHGHGYYDRFFAYHRCFRIGVWFLQTLVSDIAIDNRDISMDVVLY